MRHGETATHGEAATLLPKAQRVPDRYGSDYRTVPGWVLCGLRFDKVLARDLNNKKSPREAGIK
jgi:hypothetical protein